MKKLAFLNIGIGLLFVLFLLGASSEQEKNKSTYITCVRELYVECLDIAGGRDSNDCLVSAKEICKEEHRHLPRWNISSTTQVEK